MKLVISLFCNSDVIYICLFCAISRQSAYAQYKRCKISILRGINWQPVSHLAIVVVGLPNENKILLKGTERRKSLFSSVPIYSSSAANLKLLLSKSEWIIIDEYAYDHAGREEKRFHWWLKFSEYSWLRHLILRKKSSNGNSLPFGRVRERNYGYNFQIRKLYGYRVLKFFSRLTFLKKKNRTKNNQKRV